MIDLSWDSIKGAATKTFGKDSSEIASHFSKNAPKYLGGIAGTLIILDSLNSFRKAFDIRSNYINETKNGFNTGQRLDRFN